MKEVMPIAKRVHRAAKVSNGGQVSALCFKKPRAINLNRETWTLIDDDVTCKRCRELIKKQTAANPTE